MAEKLEIFIHGAGKAPTVVEAEATEILRDLLVRAGMPGAGNGEPHVFVGECEEALLEADSIEDGIDQHAPVDIRRSLHEHGLGHHHHVHVHRCRHIAVEVNFGSKTKRHRFSPATTVGTVAEWARRKFHLDAATAHEYVLQLCDKTDQPRPDQHLGELVDAPQCSICFNLVKEVTPQG